MSQQSEVVQNVQTDDRDNYYRTYHIKKMLGVLKKYYFRNFMSNFKSCVFQSLLKNTNKPPQIVYVEKIVNDWPYRSLLMKKNKTEHEMLELQFVSMCAEKIQSVFRGYIVRKRHTMALNRLRRFTSKALALIQGWKVRQVMRCLKIKQQMKTIKIKRAEVTKQQEALAQTQNKYSIRKLQYLQKSLHDEVTHFLRKFGHLYQTGGWVFEPKIEKPIMKKLQINKFNRRAVQPAIENNINQSQTNDFLPSQAVKQEEPKPKRVRQMRNNPRQAKNKAQAPKIEQNPIPQTKSQSYQSESTNFASQDRPIKAKGAYKYDQQSLKQQFLNQKPISFDNNAEAGQQGEGQKAESKKIDKKKYDKRQKYDPRKAIQQQKQRKKEQEQLQAKMANQKIESTSTIQIPLNNESKQKIIKQTKSQKVIKMSDKEEISNRSTVNIPRAKTKVEARIDCWGNRKTKKVSTLQNDRSINKIVAIVQQIQPQPPKNRNTNELITLEKLTNKIQERKVLNREKQREKQREQFQEERANALREMERHKEQSERVRQQNKKQSYEIHKKMSIEQNRQIKTQNILNMREKPKNVEEPARRKEMVYRPVQQLEQAYQNQYINRFQNLMPKLRLLSAARLAEQRSNIPVLSPDSFYVERMLQQNPAPQKFWQTVSRMQKTIKDFINS